MDKMLKRLDGIVPAYKLEPDPARRAMLEEAWDDAVSEAVGQRKKTTPGLLKKVKRQR